MKTYILLTFFFFFTVRGFACDCEDQGNFIQVAPKSDLVAYIRIKKFLTFKDINEEKTPMSMDAEVIEVFKGKEVRKNIIIWGDNGIMCRPYLSRFKEGELYVIAFHSSNKDHGHKNEKNTDYFISVCGTYYLPVRTMKSIKYAEGNIEPNKPKLKIQELKGLLAKLK